MENDISITEVIGHDDEGNMVYGESTIIAKKDMVQLNDPNCEHEWELDPTEDEKHFYGIKCKKCPVGKLIQK